MVTLNPRPGALYNVSQNKQYRIRLVPRVEKNKADSKKAGRDCGRLKDDMQKKPCLVIDICMCAPDEDQGGNKRAKLVRTGTEKSVLSSSRTIDW